ncbi:formyltransferase family protein [uncultured Rikenella sp.]|uniref:formyltransferase family protein n=1 Tax=uncultured Rikenella sp. TaxID=368003 RepID=UPI0026020124|nr:formyltransferase family protein [uncultured Rikenella sp.]
MDNHATTARMFLSAMERSEKIYTHYLASGRTYRDALDLKECNAHIRDMVGTDLPNLPVQMRSPAQKLIRHYDDWLSLWEDFDRSRDFGPDNLFLFENPHHFPKEAARSLIEYYRCQSLEMLFIGKKDDRNAYHAAEYVRQIFPHTTVLFGARGESFPEDMLWWKGDYIFSYLSPWIIPEGLLQRAAQGAINWHPGPPEYPGIGCTNFAVYNCETVFGITCHYMAGRVDTGRIIEVRKFRILENDTVFSVTQKCYACILNSFLSILDKIAVGDALPQSDEAWTRTPYTRKELDALCKIMPDMPLEEVYRRVKATTYDRPWAYTEIEGLKFLLK